MTFIFCSTHGTAVSTTLVCILSTGHIFLAIDDLVYMPDERLLDEYILTDVGKIWVGPYGSSRGREWVYGQFDACVLPAAMLMFEKSDLVPASRGDPIKVCRTISKLVNSNDEDGVLVGRWDGQYEDGTAPSAWTGSVQILQEYLDTQFSVSYGQCWVFSGVVSTSKYHFKTFS